MASLLHTVIANFETSLASRLANGATTGTLSSITDKDGNTIPNGTYTMIFEPGTSNEEHLRFTLTSTAMSSIYSINRQGTATSGVQAASGHRAGSKVILTDWVNLKTIKDILDGDAALDGSDPLYYDAAPTFTPGSNQLITALYADNLAIAGSPDASTTTKGIVEEATDAELQAGTAAGATSARLFAGGASHTQTAAANKVPVAKSSGKLDDGWLGLTTAGDIVYSDGTDLQRLAATTARFLRMNGTTPEWGGANLDEANTFFGATDLTGAEAETLSDGSDASSLHYHKRFGSIVSNLKASLCTVIGYKGDGATETVSGGTVTRTFVETYLESGTSATQFASLRSQVNSNLVSSWGSMKFAAGMKFSATTTQDAFIGIMDTAITSAPENSTSTSRHIGFMVEDGTLYASVADNTTQTKSSSIGSVTLTNFNTYEIIWTAATSAVFKVNGTTVATLTTNIPSGSNNYQWMVSIKTQAASNRTITLANTYALEVTVS